jgi:hypothetical protein
MKTLVFITILTLLFVNTGCKESTLENPEVGNYISSLKSGQYNAFDIPEFSPSVIPALLAYRNDTTTIHLFPRNPISSFMMLNCKLGMVALWTVESIRAVEIGSDRLIGRCPSQNPFLALRENPAVWDFDVKAQFTAAKAYHEWWMSINVFTDKMKIDPLKNTKYQWH